MSRRTLNTLFRILMLCGAVALPLSQGVWAQNELVDDIMSMMTPQERVGQLFMVDFPGQDTSDDSEIAQLILEYKIGGVVLSESRGNISNQDEVPTPLQVAHLTNELQNLAFRANSRTINGQEVFVPLFVSVEQEGNGYPRSQLRSGFTAIPSNMALGATWSEQNAQSIGGVVGRELAAIGVNMLSGPVIDVLDNPRPGGRGDLGVRAFGGNADWVARLGRAYIRGVHEGSGGRVATVAKHFPGHGRSGRDPESEVVTVDRSLEEMRGLELIPFAAVTRASGHDPLGTTDALMVGHIRCQAFQEDVAFYVDPLTLDEQGLGVAMALPEFATWSTDSLLVADSLGADAIKYHIDPAPPRDLFPHTRIAREALMAGNDILPLVRFSLGEDWSADDLPNIVDTIKYFQELYDRDLQFRDRVDESVRKILHAKIRLYPTPSLADVLVDEDLAVTVVGSGGGPIRQIAEEAVTLLDPGGDELRARLPSAPVAEDHILIVECLGGCGPFPAPPGQSLQNTLVRLYGPEGTGQVNPDNMNTLSFAQVYDWIEGNLADSDMRLVEGLMQEAEWVILALADYNPDDFPVSRAVKDLLAERDYYLSDKKVIGIAYDAPYYLDESEIGKLTAYFAVYSKAAACLEASLRPLFDTDFVPVGAAPVNVEGVGYDLRTALQPEPSQIIPLERLSPPEGDLLYVGGEPLVVRTGVIFDRNGNPVPNGTEVEFRGNYLEGEIYVEPQVVTGTIGGVAGASFWLGEPVPAGLIEVTAASGQASSEPLRVRVLVPVTPFPTFTPTPTVTPSPTLTATAVPPTRTAVPTPTATPVPPSARTVRPVDWLDLGLAGVGIFVGNVLSVQTRRGRRKTWEREVRLILYGVGLGLIGYILYGLGFLNPARILGWQGMSVRVFVLLFCGVLSFLPSGVVWPRRS